MKKNLSQADRIFRLILAVVLVVLFFTNVITGTLGIVLVVLAVVFAGTAFISWCPIYAALGIRTLKDK